jgi:hypothetical protein
LLRFESAVEVSPTHSGVGVQIGAAHDHFNRAVATNQARIALSARAARQDTERHLHPIHEYLATHAETHIARHRQLAPATTYAALELS